MGEVMTSSDLALIDRVVEALMPMKKLDVAELEAAAEETTAT